MSKRIVLTIAAAVAAIAVKSSVNFLVNGQEEDTNEPTSSPTSSPDTKQPTTKSPRTKEDCEADAPASPLCGTEEAMETITGDCSSELVVLNSIPSCCDSQTSLTDPCYKEDGYAKCRSVGIKTASCPIEQVLCREMFLKIDLEIKPLKTSCCETCACYGDPHCESFKGVIDTWVLCDARDYQPSKQFPCQTSRQQCASERDHNGNRCIWRADKPGGWNVALFGSQCVFDMQNQALPEMLMYQADQFSIKLRLGERGIIQEAVIEDAGKRYLLDANDCWDAFFESKNPWRQNEVDVAPPADPNWLAKRWVGQRLPGGDLLWTIFGLPSGIKANIRCARDKVEYGGRIRFGAPRLNVEEIIEPISPQNRTSTSGFCVTDSINKQKSTHQNSDNLFNTGKCSEGGSVLLETARSICSKGITVNGIAECKTNWCRNSRPLDPEKCELDIGRFGWQRVWCAANTIKGGNPTLCVSGDCIKCVSHIADFGWNSAIEKWKGTISVDDGEGESSCTPFSELPAKLNVCQKGMELQYEARPGEWESFLAIPNGVIPCSNTLNFSSTTPGHEVLFGYPLRFHQCSLDSTCLQDSCTPEIGFTAKFSFDSKNVIQQNLVKLVQAEDLICDPEKFSSTTKCMKIPPPKTCPCEDEDV